MDYKKYIFLFALLTLILISIVLGGFSVYARYFIFTDGTAYAKLGENLATGVGLQVCGGWHVFYPPGYPIAIAGLYLPLRDSELAGHLVSYFAYIGSVLFTALLARRIHQSVLFSMLSALVVAIHPSFVLYASYVMAESLFVCVVLGASLCCWKLARDEKPPIWLWVLWGALLGYAYLVRADGIVYAPLQALFIALCSKQAYKPRFAKLALGLGVMLIVVAPYVWFVKEVTGKWQLSSKTSIILEFARGKTPNSTSRTESQHTSQLSEDGKSFTIDKANDTLLGYLTREPGDAARRVIYNVKQLVTKPGIAFGWVHLIFLAIIGFELRKRILSPGAFFVVLHLLPICLFLVLFIDKRFLLTFLPFLAMPAARSAEILFEWAKRAWLRWPRKVSYAIIGTGVVCVIAAVPILAPKIAVKLQRIFGSIGDLPHEHREMGEWMKQNLEITPTTFISHRNPWVSFYADGCHKRTPYTDDLGVLIDWTKQVGVKYVIVDERMTKPYMPGLAFLLDEKKGSHR